MIETSPSIVKLAVAMRAVQAAVGGVPKDSTNPHFRNKYASLESVIDTIREHYLAAGLAVMQSPGPYADGAITLTTMVMHESGEWLRSEMSLPVAKQDPQGVGSALTYAERYSLMALFNLAAVDDDAETASRPAPRPVQSPPARSSVSPAPEAPPAGNISQAAVSSATRQRLMEAMGKAQTRPALRAWADNPKVATAIEGLTDKDGAMFAAEFKKRWEALPESLAMAG